MLAALRLARGAAVCSRLYLHGSSKTVREEESCQEIIFFFHLAATHDINSCSYAFSNGIVTSKLMIAL